MDLAQYRDLAAFAQFASELDKATRDQLARGERLIEILKQPQYQPLPVEKQVVIIYAGTNGYLDALPVAQVKRYQEEVYRLLETRHPGILSGLAETKQLDEQMRAALDAALKEFGQQFAGEGRTAAA